VKIKKLNILLQSLLIFLLMSFSVFASSAEKKNMVEIDWKEVSGAVRYRVQISDVHSNINTDSYTKINQIELDIKPGNYKIRIGAVNKFEKISGWSEWADIRIKKTVPYRGFKKNSVFNHGIKIGVGLPFHQIVSGWNSYYNNSLSGFDFSVGYIFANIDILKRIRAFRYTGIEFETDYIFLSGKNRYNNIETDIYNLKTGGGFFFRTDFNFPFNLIFRCGAGLSSTRQKYMTYNMIAEPVGYKTRNTADPYYRAGFSLEYFFYEPYYVETGVDFYSIIYLGENLNSVKYYFQAGIKI